MTEPAARAAEVVQTGSSAIGAGGWLALLLASPTQVGALIAFGGGAFVGVLTQVLRIWSESDRAKRLKAEAERDEARRQLEVARETIKQKELMAHEIFTQMGKEVLALSRDVLLSSGRIARPEETPDERTD